VKIMGWFDVLKMMTPRQVLEKMQEILGGSIKGTSQKTSSDFTLNHDNGYIKIQQKGTGQYFVSINGKVEFKGFDLRKILPDLEERFGEMEKVAGAVTTSSAAHSPLFSEGRTGGIKRGKKRRKKEDDDD
tara:strand:+ start:153 stop:542 length:390 start_codon:yes stop_codon:yes gene_type:complete